MTFPKVPTRVNGETERAKAEDGKNSARGDEMSVKKRLYCIPWSQKMDLSSPLVSDRRMGVQWNS